MELRKNTPRRSGFSLTYYRRVSIKIEDRADNFGGRCHNRGHSRRYVGRYATAQELADDLRRFRDDQPILARRPTMAGRMTLWSRRHRMATSAGAVILLMVSLASAAGMARLWQERRQTLAALAKAESAQTSERQALLFTFSASDQITARALERLAASPKASPETDHDIVALRTGLVDDFPDNWDYPISLAYHQIDLCEQMEAFGRQEEAMRIRESILTNAQFALS